MTFLIIKLWLDMTIGTVHAPCLQMQTVWYKHSHIETDHLTNGETDCCLGEQRITVHGKGKIFNFQNSCRNHNI